MCSRAWMCGLDQPLTPFQRQCMFSIPVTFFVPGAKRPVKAVTVPVVPTPYSANPETSTTPVDVLADEPASASPSDR